MAHELKVFQKGKPLSLQTQSEMARGRGAVNEAMFLSEISEKHMLLQKKTSFVVQVEPVILGNDPDEWEVHCTVKRWIGQEPPYLHSTHNLKGKFELLLEVIEKRNEFPSEFFIAQLMLVS